MLPTTKTTRELDPRKQAVFLYGAPKVGKSTFCAGLFGGNVLFLDTEQGTRNLDRYCVAVSSWWDFIAAVEALHREDHPYQCVAVDTVDALRDLCIRAVCEKMQIPDISHPKFSSHGRGWGQVNQRFSDGIKLLFSGAWGVVFVGHEKTEERTPDGRLITIDENYKGPRVLKAVPSLSNRQRLMISGLSDIILRAGIDGDRRVLTSAPSETVEAGDRSGILPPVFDMDPEVYTEFFRAAMRAESSKKAQ